MGGVVACAAVKVYVTTWPHKKGWRLWVFRDLVLIHEQDFERKAEAKTAATFWRRKLRFAMFLILLYLITPPVGWACAGNSDMLRDPAAVRGAILAGQCTPFVVEAL